MQFNAGLQVKRNANNLVTVVAKFSLVLLQHDAKSSLHLNSCPVSPQGNQIDKQRQDIFGNQKSRLKSFGSLKVSFSFRIESNVCVQNTQAITN